MVWLGMHYDDLKDLPPACFQPLSETDIKKARSLLLRQEILDRPEWKHELEQMLEKNMKAEIQALASISLSHLSESYLPSKINKLLQSEE